VLRTASPDGRLERPELAVRRDRWDVDVSVEGACVACTWRFEETAAPGMGVTDFDVAVVPTGWVTVSAQNPAKVATVAVASERLTR